jgi:hypothetical protein
MARAMFFPPIEETVTMGAERETQRYRPQVQILNVETEEERVWLSSNYLT